VKLISDYINGALVAHAGNNYLDNIEPATGNVNSKISDSDSEDVRNAVNAATAAYSLKNRFMK